MTDPSDKPETPIQRALREKKERIAAKLRSPRVAAATRPSRQPAQRPVSKSKPWMSRYARK